MWDKFINLFKGSKLGLALDGLKMIEPFLEHLEENFENNHEAKNALIDAIIQILEVHKEKTIGNKDGPS